MKSIKNTNYFPLDVARLVMAFVVIAIHTTRWECAYINRFLELAVPFFFLTSGFFLQQNSSDEAHGGATVKFWLSRVIKMYFIWTSVYLPFTIYGYFLENDTLANCFMGLLLGTGKYAWHLWYLVASILGGGIIYVCKTLRINYFLVLSFSLIVFAILYYSDITHPDHYIIYAIKRIIRGLIFLLLGMGIHKYVYPILRIRKKQCFLFSISLFLIFLFKGGEYLFFGSVSLFCIILMICEIIKYEDLTRGKFLREISAFIYFVHMIFVGVLSILWGMEDSLAKFGIVSILSFMIAFIKVKFLRSKN